MQAGLFNKFSFTVYMLPVLILCVEVKLFDELVDTDKATISVSRERWLAHRRPLLRYWQRSDESDQQRSLSLLQLHVPHVHRTHANRHDMYVNEANSHICFLQFVLLYL